MTLERSIQRTPIGSPLAMTIVCTSMFVIGLGVALVSLTSDEPAVTHVEVAPAAAPVVLPVTVPVTVTMPPVVAPVIAAEPVEPAGRPRALVPVLDAVCVDSGYADDHPECAWDDGFPAISADGKTIVSKSIPDDGGRGYPGLTLELIDVATSHVTRRIKILDPDEYDEEGHAHRAKVARRTAAANQLIEAGRFRSLVPIATMDDAESPSPLRAEVTGESIRVVDANTTTVVWQARFSAQAAYPNLEHDPEQDMCGTADTSEIQAWWDEQTRTIVAGVSYAFGPSCMCGGESKTYVRHAR